MSWGSKKKAKAKSGGKRNFKKIAAVALWESDNSREGGPVLYGTVEDEEGNEIGRLSLWESDSDHEKAPVLNGSITREVKQQEQDFDDDDDKPF